MFAKGDIEAQQNNSNEIGGVEQSAQAAGRHAKLDEVLQGVPDKHSLKP